jgi:hypothetical protein
MTQAQRIVSHMQAYGSITTMEGFEMGITRLAARVNDLRRNGIPVITETVVGTNRYGEKVRFARYRLAGGAQECFMA